MEPRVDERGFLRCSPRELLRVLLLLPWLPLRRRFLYRAVHRHGELPQPINIALDRLGEQGLHTLGVGDVFHFHLILRHGSSPPVVVGEW